MTSFAHRIHPSWSDVLGSVLGRARELGAGALLAFDLDSTLFDNRPRQARILREYGEFAAQPLLKACGPEHWSSGWDLRAAMQACGLSAGEAGMLYASAKAFWQERFFTSAYCVDDVAVPGAAPFLAACNATGATIAYVTGRHEQMRAGTVEAMRRCGFVIPSDPRTVLLMKPTFEQDDDGFKRVAHAQLLRLGELVAAFDNEPTHANDYRRRFPEAIVVHLATDHSGREVALLDGIVTVPHFDRRSA